MYKVGVQRGCTMDRMTSTTMFKEKEKAEESVTRKTRESKGKSLTAPTPNQEANKQPPVEKKGRPSYPGAWVKGDSDNKSSNTRRNLEPAKNSGKECNGQD
ncbi:uncharacterized protein VP01_11564g1 [Puccinia sorghi]|uniref:Uncharacterized protein n=1 Tax=Puccinia sorghi TaxID=27349 RepID=A0A0L6VRM7_9BASI|nr:uncharacterized protein VP01_11564g1 [Puccinia sorghi]